MKLQIPDEYMSNIKEVKSASKAVNWLPGKKKKLIPLHFHWRKSVMLIARVTVKHFRETVKQH